MRLRSRQCARLLWPPRRSRGNRRIAPGSISAARLPSRSSSVRYARRAADGAAGKERSESRGSEGVSRGKTAVDVNHLAGDLARIIAAQEKRGIRHVFLGDGLLDRASFGGQLLEVPPGGTGNGQRVGMVLA